MDQPDDPSTEAERSPDALPSRTLTFAVPCSGLITQDTTTLGCKAYKATGQTLERDLPTVPFMRAKKKKTSLHSAD